MLPPVAFCVAHHAGGYTVSVVGGAALQARVLACDFNSSLLKHALQHAKVPAADRFVGCAFSSRSTNP